MSPLNLTQSNHDARTIKELRTTVSDLVRENRTLKAQLGIPTRPTRHMEASKS